MLQDTFLGEIVGAVILSADHPTLNSTFQTKRVKIDATGVESEDGQIIIDEKQGKPVKILENVDPLAYYDIFAQQLGEEEQSAVIGSFDEQKQIWGTPASK